jgi:uncharacterized protein (DUF2147 family)
MTYSASALRTIGATLAIAAATLAAQPVRAADPASAVGFWLNDEKDSIIEIAPCGRRTMCGYLRAYRGKEDETDSRNPNVAQRNRPVCGLKIIGKLMINDQALTGGSIYDPVSGGQYSLSAVVVTPNKLKLRAYEGFEAFGETLIWTRSTKIPGSCKDV